MGSNIKLTVALALFFKIYLANSMPSQCMVNGRFVCNNNRSTKDDYCSNGRYYSGGFCWPSTANICPPNSAYLNNVCLYKNDVLCPVNMVYNSGVCVRPNTSLCSSKSSCSEPANCQPTCIICPTGYIYYGGKCVPQPMVQCPIGVTLSNGKCHVYQESKDVACSDDNDEECINHHFVCPYGSSYIKDKCHRVLPCPERSFAYKGICIECPSDTVLVNQRCERCKPDMIMENNRCVCRQDSTLHNGRCIPKTTINCSGQRSNNDCLQTACINCPEIETTKREDNLIHLLGAFRAFPAGNRSQINNYTATIHIPNISNSSNVTNSISQSNNSNSNTM